MFIYVYFIQLHSDKKLNVAEILLQNKANPNILGDPDRGNYSALHFAVYDGN